MLPEIVNEGVNSDKLKNAGKSSGFFEDFLAFYRIFLGKMLAIAQVIVVLYFSIPHGASTFCLCQMVGRRDETAGGKN